MENEKVVDVMEVVAEEGTRGLNKAVIIGGVVAGAALTVLVLPRLIKGAKNLIAKKRQQKEDSVNEPIVED